MSLVNLNTKTVNKSKYNQHIEELKNYLWWYVLIIPVLRGLRQEDHKVKLVWAM